MMSYAILPTFMQKLDNTTAHSMLLTKICKLRMHTQQQKFLVETDFSDSTHKFKGL